MDTETRKWQHAVSNGLRCRCPRCGKARLYRRYLSVYETCPECGLDLSRRPGEILAGYAVITIVGLILIGILYLFVMVIGVHPVVALSIGLPLGVLLPLALLPSLKGAVIGFQWAKGVQGFGEPEP